MAKQNGVERVFVHCFMDGRDTPPDSGAGYIEQLQQKMREYGIGKIATVSGRYYAMDRDRRWDRERKAFDAMVHGKAEGGRVHRSGAGNEGFLQPRRYRRVCDSVCCADERDEPVGTIRDDDVVINFNFRADRARQITRCLARESDITPQAVAISRRRGAGQAAIPRRRVPKTCTTSA